MLTAYELHLVQYERISVHTIGLPLTFCLLASLLKFDILWVLGNLIQIGNDIHERRKKPLSSVDEWDIFGFNYMSPWDCAINKAITFPQFFFLRKVSWLLWVIVRQVVEWVSKVEIECSIYFVYPAEKPSSLIRNGILASAWDAILRNNISEWRDVSYVNKQ